MPESKQDSILALKKLLLSPNGQSPPSPTQPAHNPQNSPKRKSSEKTSSGKKASSKPKKEEVTYHASSAFMNSPDPNSVPLPNFDEAFNEALSTESAVNSQVESLRRILKIRA